MTVKELYELLKAKGLEDKEVRVIWRDGGGIYDGCFDELEEEYVPITCDEDAVYL